MKLLLITKSETFTQMNDLLHEYMDLYRAMMKLKAVQHKLKKRPL